MCNLSWLLNQFLLAALLVGVVSSSASATVVRFTTSLGNIDVRLYDTATPVSVQNFLNYATTGRYDGTFIHRVPQLPDGGTSDFVVQGGGFKLNNSIFAATGITTDAPIINEPVFSNTRGTLAYAKNASGATSQWFFNIGDNSFLDAQNFTVFGRVIGNGMSVVDAINNLETVDASIAQNAPGEDFDEIPVRNLEKVQAQGDITAADAVMILSITIRNLAAADYTFDGVVNNADYNWWKTNFGSTALAAPDGNGNGVVDAADYVLWRKMMANSGSGSAATAPEPSSAVLLLLSTIGCLHCRRNRVR